MLTDNHQGSSSIVPGTELVSRTHQANTSKDSTTAGLKYEAQKQLEFQSWEDVFQNCGSGFESLPLHPSFSSIQPDTMESIPNKGRQILEHLFTDSFPERKELGTNLNDQEQWQVIFFYLIY